ncbi:hypothetical protein HAX54_022561, partial [Datura stramonium]|nr:hypothetical protein [Datura stramonium]
MESSNRSQKHDDSKHNLTKGRPETLKDEIVKGKTQPQSQRLRLKTRTEGKNKEENLQELMNPDSAMNGFWKMTTFMFLLNGKMVYLYDDDGGEERERSEILERHRDVGPDNDVGPMTELQTLLNQHLILGISWGGHLEFAACGGLWVLPYVFYLTYIK